MTRKVDLIAKSHEYILQEQQKIIKENVDLKNEVKELIDFISYQDKKYDFILAQKEFYQT